MATTKSAFVKLTAAQLVGATVAAAGQVVALNESNATQIVNGASGTRLDLALTNLATAGYAKNGAATVALTGTTPVTITLADLTSATASSAGDTVFATVNKLVLKNTGAADLTVAPGGSNPFDLFLAGTTPTLTVPAGSTITIESVAGKTVDSTHKTILITPTAGGSFAIAVGGA
jgi:hypothetical protein